MALEGHDVCSLVWTKLVADAGAGGVNTLLGGTPTTPGRIYRDRVPQAAALPAATITLVSSVDTNTLSGIRAMNTTQVDVRVVGPGASYGPLVPIATRVDTVLQGAFGTQGSTYAFKLRRTDLRAFVEDDAGAAFTHVIGTYLSEAESLTS